MTFSYKDRKVFVFDDSFIRKNKLTKKGVDSSGWRIFYTNETSNWIVFYPYSEYHGGGQPYIIEIDELFEDWLSENSNFEERIRKIIEEK